mmetsp:Transcript_8874/g.28014  ORF Transcript_8874/g.28014 Transcript_8874/m.28014 type:complete len:371 (-) Transcript_8874:119-1231(-)
MALLCHTPRGVGSAVCSSSGRHPRGPTRAPSRTLSCSGVASRRRPQRAAPAAAHRAGSAALPLGGWPSGGWLRPASPQARRSGPECERLRTMAAAPAGRTQSAPHSPRRSRPRLSQHRRGLSTWSWTRSRAPTATSCSGASSRSTSLQAPPRRAGRATRPAPLSAPPPSLSATCLLASRSSSATARSAWAEPRPSPPPPSRSSSASRSATSSDSRRGGASVARRTAPRRSRTPTCSDWGLVARRRWQRHPLSRRRRGASRGRSAPPPLLRHGKAVILPSHSRRRPPLHPLSSSGSGSGYRLQMLGVTRRQTPCPRSCLLVWPRATSRRWRGVSSGVRPSSSCTLPRTARATRSFWWSCCSGVPRAVPGPP